MSTSTTARLLIDDLPEYGAGVKRYMIDCHWGTTVLHHFPGPVDLAERHLISVALQRHEEECQRCNLAPLWRQYGDTALKALVDAAWDRMQAEAAWGRRN